MSVQQSIKMFTLRFRTQKVKSVAGQSLQPTARNAVCSFTCQILYTHLSGNSCTFPWFTPPYRHGYKLFQQYKQLSGCFFTFANSLKTTKYKLIQGMIMRYLLFTVISHQNNHYEPDRRGYEKRKARQCTQQIGAF